MFLEISIVIFLVLQSVTLITNFYILYQIINGPQISYKARLSGYIVSYFIEKVGEIKPTSVPGFIPMTSVMPFSFFERDAFNFLKESGFISSIVYDNNNINNVHYYLADLFYTQKLLDLTKDPAKLNKEISDQISKYKPIFINN